MQNLKDGKIVILFSVYKDVLTQGRFSRRWWCTWRGDHLGPAVLCRPTCKPGDHDEDDEDDLHQLYALLCHCTIQCSLAQVRWEWCSLRLDNDDDDVHHYCCFFILHPGAPKNQPVYSGSGPDAVGVGQS